MGGARAYAAQAQYDSGGAGRPICGVWIRVSQARPSRRDARSRRGRIPGAPQLRGGEQSDATRRAGTSRPPGLPSAGGGVPPSRPVASSPCADSWPGLAFVPPRPGVRSGAAFASRLPASPRCPGRAGRSFPFRSPCRPLPLPAFSRPASRAPLDLPPAAAPLASPPESSAPQSHSSLFGSMLGRGGQGKRRDSFPLGCPWF